MTPKNPTVRKDNGAATKSDDTTEYVTPVVLRDDSSPSTNVAEIAEYADSELSHKLMSISCTARLSTSNHGSRN